MPNEFSELLDQLTAAETANTDLAKAMNDASELDADGKPKKKPLMKDMEGGDDTAENPDDIAKSFQVTLPSGEQADAIDATAILKALDADVGTIRTAMPRLLKVISDQGKMLKALSDQLGTVRTQGSGRRSMVTISERQSPATREPKKVEGMTPGEFMAKALDCVNAGKLNASQASYLDAQMARGQQPDPEIAAIVMGLSA